jgi:hypothetical protein
MYFLWWKPRILSSICSDLSCSPRILSDWMLEAWSPMYDATLLEAWVCDLEELYMSELKMVEERKRMQKSPMVTALNPGSW